MRPIVAHLFSSLDGVVSDPHLFQTDFSLADAHVVTAVSSEAGDAIMGRRIYEEWAAWWPAHPHPDDFGAIIHPMPKHVASRTLSGPLGWENAQLIAGQSLEDFALELAATDDARGPIAVFGISVIRQLLLAGLIDELTLSIHPVLAGQGARLSDGIDGPLPLTLVRCLDTESGAVHATYASKD